MAYEIITSVQNPLVKRLHQLLDKKGREEQGRFLVEGAHLVEEALKSGAHVVTVLYDQERNLDPACQRALANHPQDTQVIAASAAVLAKLSETKSPQGIVAEVNKTANEWDEWVNKLSDQDDTLLLFLDEIQDPGNLGTILRTAEAAGVDGVVLGKGSVDIYNGKVVRATMGAMFRLPLFMRELGQAAEEWKRQGGRVLVSSLAQDSVAYDQAEYSGKIALVIGNEGRGVSKEMLACADQFVHIPLYGKAESLNAAVAAGIFVYEAQRNRRR
ncbi:MULTISPECIES: 23S rRNA (guanosine(2251)-2'-O)-methyltransferase RlmB [Brevibacillus]|jgi:rRNA methylase, putative, group 3|uniref:23S rRNA methyltransferase n=1 Tax=Brevibacillus parabrevis TaxID=54914 RepID=A0A4Y3PJN9_BREPA|nr:MULTISPECIES: 23S rRNA (guanosine(2251)-2'-O)-methyltransferase RlmB [Brevibacillus]TGV12021.1 23S rRNA (guanosine(2251)-2'-O)-methyltransferase RlmB [Mesorhizobium sp. M00.F.Ca.ET.186.01.1.1]MBU8713051.1 23S rRNA (guanosine(2251)-2'-O)-methyltransferase RlmB [Brevibacillus parabrevis]MDH6348572.1 TrmH family RNA methyltransferase [Brevibacillus sp. 1238]MDR5002281.1 23S rRNA (guanosine(2251)-2'-O)-methyltransferase RlmB [Brevibacillus parabrevis]MED2256339.1 23S rRNA (guanosine(2251)-2'-O)